MSRVVLGNRHATDSTDDGTTRTALPRGKRATVVEIPDDLNVAQAFTAITAAGGVWAHQTGTKDVDGDLVPNDKAVPAWVASDDAALASILAAHWGGIEIRDLEEPQ
jgi:hypothetical protein